jgi:putative Mn2+ efflux pump MntP
MLLVILLGISLSMDAFSLSLCLGTLNLAYKKIITFTIIVGIFHFTMPLLGMNISHILLSIITFNPKYITVVTFVALGIFMIFDREKDNANKLINIFSFILFGFIVSIDSLVAGIGLDIIYNNHMVSALIISTSSMLFTLSGLLLGKYISKKIGNISKIIGGIILIALAIQYLTK